MNNDFESMIDAIMLTGISLSLACDYAVKIGDTPEFNEAGTVWIVREIMGDQRSPIIATIPAPVQFRPLRGRRLP